MVIFLFIADKRAAEDPDYKVAECFSTMPRDEVYDQSVRIFTSLAQKVKDYGYEDSPNFNYYAELVFHLIKSHFSFSISICDLRNRLDQ